MWQISAGLGLALLVLSGAFKLYYDKKEAETEMFEKIRKKFSKHNLNMLSLRKPKLIENIVNRGTRAVGKDFEKLTDPKQFNESDNSITIAAN